MSSFWNFVKINVIMVAAGFVFNPLNAFAITNKVQAIYDVNYKVGSNHVDMAPILVMASILFVVLFAYYWANAKPESIPRCKRCGSPKHDQKCLSCKFDR
jgi:hypothetical protein